jgi:cell division protein ZapA (FtsZ GTPase activity inhibitor)
VYPDNAPSPPRPPVQVVEVELAGRLYRLRGEDPALLRALAARVDDALAEVAGASGLRDDFKVAVLAALNLASEHEERREAWLARARAIGERARRLEESLLQLAAAVEPVDEARG